MSSDQNSEDFYGRGNNAAAGRGIALVVVAIAVGLAVLKWGLDDTSTAGTAPAKITTTTAAKTTTTPPPGGVTTLDPNATPSTSSVIPQAALRDPSLVAVQVANGSGQNGVGSQYSTQLTTANYVAKKAKTGKATTTSVVYYKETYQQEAVVVATLLKIPVTSVLPVPPEGLAGKDEDLMADKPNIVVIIGSDLVPATNG